MDAPSGVSADAALKTRPVLQTGSYGEFIGQIILKVDSASNEVASYAGQRAAHHDRRR